MQSKEDFADQLAQLFAEALSEGLISDAVIIYQDDDGLGSMGTMPEAEAEGKFPKRSLRLVSHWMYHVFTFPASHSRLIQIKVPRKAKKARVYDA